MKSITIITTTEKTYNVHSEKAKEPLHDTDFYSLDNLSPEEIQAKGLFLVSTTENIAVQKAGDE